MNLNLSKGLIDNHGRKVDYLRLAVTDRCNLRCTYCMPAEGIAYLQEKQLLSWEEMSRLVNVLVGLGITKVRLTGGEPFLRKGIMEFLQEISKHPSLEICITSNGVLLGNYLEELNALGVRSINLSLDSLDPIRFHEITRRDEYEQVMASLHRMLDLNFKVKINAVVMKGKNEQDILALANFAKEYPVSVRFIEEMPFNGEGEKVETLNWLEIKDLLFQGFDHIFEIPMMMGDTAQRYQMEGFKGDVGIIAAHSRTFCGTCNRLRITAKGQVKTCLYDDGVFDLKTYLRSGVSDDELRNILINLNQKRPVDGFEAENNRKNTINESMTTIGG
ncbi:GTP 3',8-cyclase MoaA [Sandaracinomonas limnophila]|uniref:GTP 3',8-cyclase n=1 Tax=Sandaracinomonas limnophila TaxID=1862386 RepID=A0A437PTR9_9BACT|nr:GTP 3',8-cyclase MoaA [Sandaracinomonas limnophila]